MSDAPAGADQAPAYGRSLTLGDGFHVTVERPNGVKVTRSFAILRSISTRLPEIAKAWGDYQRDYRQSHATLVDRGYAMLRWGPQPLLSDGAPVLFPSTDGDGNAHPKAGEVVIVPSPLEAMSEEAWAARGQKIEMPADPPRAELVAAVFDRALDVAEEHVYRIVALFTITNDEATSLWIKGDGALDKRIGERVEELLSRVYGDELIELATVVGEVVEDNFVRRVNELGDRAGKLLRLVGMGPTPATSPETPQTPAEGSQTSSEENTETPSDNSPASSTPTGSNTDGAGENPSELPTSSSERSTASATSGGDN
jgi:hypothetical protein